MNNNIYKNGLVVVLIIAVIIIASLWVKLTSKDDDIVSDNNLTDIRSTDNEEESENSNNENMKRKNVKIIVDVEGSVNNPGVYEFYEGDRVEDAIKRAGGLKENACTKSINRARKMLDGEKIYIYADGEEISGVENNDDSIYNSMVGSESIKKVNINTASREILMTLKGIGEVYADRIIEYRKKNKFESIEDIKEVEGIGDKTFEKIKDYITVD